MTAPAPAIPSFVDGQVVHQGDLNALAQNLTNLYAYNQGGFRTQRPCVIAKQNNSQPVNNQTDTLLTFNAAPVNTDNMWVVSAPDRLTIQTAGIYFLFSQVRWPSLSGINQGSVFASNLMVNGTNPLTNTIATQTALAILQTTPDNAGPTPQCATVANLSVGAVVYLDVWQNCGNQVTQANFGSTFLGAVFLTPST